MIDSQDIIHLSDAEDNNHYVISFDPDNADYKAYLIWLEKGNTPEPAENL